MKKAGQRSTENVDLIKTALTRTLLMERHGHNHVGDHAVLLFTKTSARRRQTSAQRFDAFLLRSGIARARVPSSNP
jgi:hypothetical protein